MDYDPPPQGRTSETVSGQDLKCDLDRLDRELHQQIQSKLEAWKQVEDLTTDLAHHKQLLVEAKKALDWIKRNGVNNETMTNGALTRINQALGETKTT